MRELIKARRIADEIVGYLLRHHVYNLNIKLDISDSEIRVRLEGKLSKELEDLEDVVKMMNIERVPELEEYYENLLGADYGSNDMNLLGVMVDKAWFERSEDRVTMEVIRYIQDVD